MTILSHHSSQQLISAAIKDFSSLANELLSEKETISVLLTGGTLGIEFIAALSEVKLDWNRVWLMFSDERFVELDAEDRNEFQAMQAWPSLANHLNRFPRIEQGLEAARKEQEQALTERFGAFDKDNSVFDLTILGMGPDAHVASLFPESNQSGGWVIAEQNSPKPPSERLSLSYQALNRSARVWFLAAGEAKRWAVSQSLNPDSTVPAARVRGALETRWYLDKEITDGL